MAEQQDDMPPQKQFEIQLEKSQVIEEELEEPIEEEPDIPDNYDDDGFDDMQSNRNLISNEKTVTNMAMTAKEERILSKYQTGLAFLQQTQKEKDGPNQQSPSE